MRRTRPMELRAGWSAGGLLRRVRPPRNCNIIDSTITGTTVTETDANGVELVWTDYGDVEPEQRRDKRGRLLPCCEYDFYRWGWPRNQFQE